MENKSITNAAKLLLSIWNSALFAAVWFLFYNNYTFDRFWLPGGLMSCFLFFVIYEAFCSLYQAFRIASATIPDTVVGQVISFGIADAVLYVECCLVYNRYADILPGLGAALLQGAGTVLIVLKAKQYLIRHITPKKTLVLYGKRPGKEAAEQFAERLLKKYDHLFAISRIAYDRLEPEKLQELIEQNETIILYEGSVEQRGKIIKSCTEQRKCLYFTPRVEDLLCQGTSQKSLLDTPLMKYDYKYEYQNGYFGKRTLDLVFALFFLVLFSPFFLLTALAVKLEDGGPVFFRQKRCTKDGKVFEMVKFRSMVVDAEKDGAAPCTGKDPRITKVGRVIRAARLDELPQLWNILKGDMSFVGPRPERVEHVMQYTQELPEFAYRLRVKGGLTGYAQIFGKYNTSAYDKLRLDLIYIENQSIFLDIKLLLLTFKTMFQKESTEGFEEEKSEEMRVKIQETEESGEIRKDNRTGYETGV